MTIDATDFVAQGKPTREQAKAVWDSFPKPSCRLVMEELRKRGFSIGYSTVNRWKNLNWGDESHANGRVDLAEKGQIKGIKGIVKRELEAEAASKALTTGLERAVAGSPDMAEMERLQSRLDELVLKSEAELDRAEAKARKIYNILLMEQAARKVNVMVLVPKDTAALVSAMTQAAGSQLTGGADQPPSPGDPNVIDVSPNKPAENEKADELDQFLRDSGRRNVA